MKFFSDAYAQARTTARDYQFASEWQKFLTDDVGMKLIFADATGPNPMHGKKMEKLREKLTAISGECEATSLMKMAGVNPAGTQAMTTKQANAVATLKLIRHFYLEHKQGAKSLWVWANPLSLHKWIYDELKTATPTSAKAKLNKIDEVFSKTARGQLATAINQANAWAGKCVAKLGNPNTDTLEKVQTWFCDGNADKKTVEETAATLLTGFKAICAIINSNKLIFSDDPVRRVKGAESGKNASDKWKRTRASVAADRGEKLDVVYIKGSLLRDLGRDTKEWAVIRTLVHEMSHRMPNGTKDVSYRHQGIKPGGEFVGEHPLKNADSWAFFAADINEKIPDAARTKYYKTPDGLRASYKRWLEKQKGN